MIDSLNYRIRLACKAILLVYTALILMSTEYRIVCPGLDSSHIFGINYFADKHIIFGKDVIWTFGPLGFLIRPMDIGSNLYIAIWFQLIVWAILLSVIIYFSLKKVFSISQLVLFAFFILLSRTQKYTFDDYSIFFLIVLLLSASAFRKKWDIFYIISVLFSILLCFIKFDSAFMALSSLMSFILIMVFLNKKMALKTAAISFIFIPLLFVFSYLIYDPSFSNLLSYIKGIYEICSGYNSFSIPGQNREFIVALIFFIFYFLLIFILFKSKQSSSFIPLLFIAPLFIAFKHGFVRQDSHVLNFFRLFLFSFGIIFLFTDIKRIKMYGKFIITTIILIIFLISAHPPYSIKTMGLVSLNGIHNFKETIKILQHRHNLKEIENLCLQKVKLLSDWLIQIGAQSIGVFPYELSYIAANRLNYKPFPVFQAYSAYTSYLDFLNAHHLENKYTAPEFILLEWQTVDDHHLLADVPATWLSVYKWYDSKEKSNDLLLLKRREKPRFSKIKFINKIECRKGDFIEIPISEHPVIANIHMKLNITGKLAKFFFRIPEVRMELLMDSSYITSFRIFSETLNDGIFINFLPLELEQIYTLINNKAKYLVKGFKIYGKGLSLYIDKINIEFYNIPEIKIDLK